MKAIVDCNNFYCSCERIFAPHLEGKPVVVLSNNDGCVISRSDEARTLGIPMGAPYFKIKETISKHNVSVFSSNYSQYGNMSWRVMETIKQIVGINKVEIYSIDEAFIDLKAFNTKDLHDLAFELKTKIELWTGIKVSVGVGPTKTLAKLANNTAKKNKEVYNCIFVLDGEEKIREILKKTRVGSIWGIGKKFADKLVSLGIVTGWDLYNMPEAWIQTHMGGVVGVRMLKELHGQEALTMANQLYTKKMIAKTRMFGHPVRCLGDIKEAIATYTSKAAEKLRRQQSAATIISVFVVQKDQKGSHVYKHGAPITSYHILASPTSITHELIKPALQITERIYETGKMYQKAGVILSGIVPDGSLQTALFDADKKNVCRLLMDKMDNINASMKADIIKFASTGTHQSWNMRQDYLSKRFTTRWDEIYEVK
ncbi:MAG: Y-family DNA polymerase [Flavisolibacter sp.]